MLCIQRAMGKEFPPDKKINEKCAHLKKPWQFIYSKSNWRKYNITLQCYMNDPFINPNWKPKFEIRLSYIVIFATSLGLPGSKTKTSSMTQEVNSSVMWSCPPVFGQARDPKVVRWKVMGASTCMTVSSVHSIFQSCNCRYCYGTICVKCRFKKP